ncbi:MULTISPECIES: DUF3383 family protein [unclassified Aureimonas]|uniref:DUF3383 family protein n=1 Tax=unclassified Aureimonas TaxID=2615206 RepID=UPI000701026E|nr:MULTISPECIES: DUF3383 family protein [unclassified Aureimonas]KQT52221.1 hypothetical protein ASG62_16315 [Aureimonas sp. Leaf427]KQT70545.1 hypothetical protein ASG54_21635 [Aureimonas sp. Leaf460]
MTVPISRFVNVQVTRKDRFAAIEGFGVALLLQSKAVTGSLDATRRTKVYGAIEEVAVDFVPTDAFYIAAEQAFAQRPRPLQIKAGFVSLTAYTAAATPTLKKAAFKTELDAIQDFDEQWYWSDVEATLRDSPAAQGLIEWVQARRKIASITSNDAGIEDLANTTNIAAVNKTSGFDRTRIFYHTDAAKYPGFANAAKLGSYNFDEEGAGYTAKFKAVEGLAPLNKRSSVVQAITGFVPALGRNPAAGHLADTYVDTKGISLVVEGGTLNKDVFIDEVHACDWLAARMEEEVFNAMLANKRIAMDNPRGMAILAGACEAVMVRADRAGIVARYLDTNGDIQPSFIVTPGDVNAISAAQRKQRIAPATDVTFRYAGAVHYATVNISVEF